MTETANILQNWEKFQALHKGVQLDMFPNNHLTASILALYFTVPGVRIPST